MNDRSQNICGLFIANRDAVKKVYSLESMYIYPVAANIITAAGSRADADKLEECKKIIKKNSGLFSYLRGSVQPPIAAKLCISDDPEADFGRISDIYETLKKHFRPSEYLALLAMLTADMIDAARAEKLGARGKVIYKLMEKEHPFLTSAENSFMAGFMAFSEKSDDELIRDTEECFGLLRKRFSDRNAVQTASNILTLAEGSPEDKTARMIGLFDMVSNAGRKYGKHYELATLAAVSLLDAKNEDLCAEMLEFDEFLGKQKGYGGLGIDKTTRLMHAAMLTADLHQSTETVNIAASASALSLIAAQQAALCAVIASTAAASAAASSN